MRKPKDSKYDKSGNIVSKFSKNGRNLFKALSGIHLMNKSQESFTTNPGQESASTKLMAFPAVDSRSYLTQGSRTPDPDAVFYPEASPSVRKEMRQNAVKKYLNMEEAKQLQAAGALPGTAEHNIQHAINASTYAEPPVQAGDMEQKKSSFCKCLYLLTDLVEF
eukprot:snap_masked-scaffold_43-processed-gene-0.6-mRNA-1 protein AED:1.00 eAED:1.00 QI:0/0/0/0/1/1/2/0/163